MRWISQSEGQIGGIKEQKKEISDWIVEKQEEAHDSTTNQLAPWKQTRDKEVFFSVASLSLSFFYC